MDPIRTSHIRRFANAISLALQGHAQGSMRGEAVLRSVLDSFAVSHQTAVFASQPIPMPGVAATKAGELELAKPLQQAVAQNERSTSVAQRAALPSPGEANITLVTMPSQISRTKIPVGSLSSVSASRFFASVPWGGKSDAVRVDIKPVLMEISKPQQQILASRFFVALPWASRSIRSNLAIGAGQDDIGRAKNLALLTGRSLHQGPSIPQQLIGGRSESTTASNFFRKLPWAGSRAGLSPSI